MPFESNWYIESVILYTRITGVADRATLFELTEYFKPIIEGIERHHVHHIVDARDVESITLRMKDLQDLQKDYPPPNNLGWIILITGQSPMIRGFLNLISAAVASLFKQRSRIFSSLPDALAFLAELDEGVTSYQIEQLDAPIQEPSAAKK